MNLGSRMDQASRELEREVERGHADLPERVRYFQDRLRSGHIGTGTWLRTRHPEWWCSKSDVFGWSAVLPSYVNDEALWSVGELGTDFLELRMIGKTLRPLAPSFETQKVFKRVAPALAMAYYRATIIDPDEIAAARRAEARRPKLWRLMERVITGFADSDYRPYDLVERARVEAMSRAAAMRLFRRTIPDARLGDWKWTCSEVR